MKITIRNGAFETNSSSTHTVVIGKQADVVDWALGNPHVYLVDGQIVRFGGMTRKEFEEMKYTQVHGEDWEYFITPSGVEMAEFTIYGFDG